jgi:hypothetical protein
LAFWNGAGAGGLTTNRQSMNTPLIHQDLARLLASRVIQPTACLSQLPCREDEGAAPSHDFLLVSARTDLLPDRDHWTARLEIP